MWFLSTLFKLIIYFHLPLLSGLLTCESRKQVNLPVIWPSVPLSGQELSVFNKCPRLFLWNIPLTIQCDTDDKTDSKMFDFFIFFSTKSQRFKYVSYF